MDIARIGAPSTSLFETNLFETNPLGGSQSMPGIGSFNSVVEQFIGDVNNEQIKADMAVENLVTGKTDNVQEVVMQLAQADLSFRMFTEVRDKVVDAYQEIMRMQL
jgi:flagellar hook-basal body complex protein FliE